jgi:RNA polymerase sigma-70 factor (ECF subfamily)
MSEIDDLKGTLREGRDRFAAVVETIRPELHRYCSRMTGSALDGEDLVQETLTQALYRVTLLSGQLPALRPWLFTIAHHKCVDFLRSRSGHRMVDVEEGNEPALEIEVEIEERDLASRLFSRLVLALPPRERAAIVLKEVLGYTLPEVAAILETSVGGVKAALHRGREKIAAAKDAPELAHEPSPPVAAAYIEAFNRRDWARLQSFFEDEVSCEVVGVVHHVGRAALEDNYLATYAGLPFVWKLALGEIDGEPAIVCLRETDGKWTARHAIRIEWRGDRVARIRDYAHACYLLTEARVSISVTTDPSL